MSQAVTRVYMYAFNLGVALLANALHKPKNNRALAEDFAPSTFSTQGTWIPRLLGKRRIGCVAAWLGDRQSFLFTAGASTGGKGSKKRRTQNKQVVYSEAGWDLLCVGPAKRLTKIWADGKVIWEGSIDSTSDPSGSTIPVGTGEEFVIFWGEADQDVNTFLGDASRVGVSSRWPNLCYVVWLNKALGPQPRWPQLEYELEVEPEQSPLAHTPIVTTGPPVGANPAHVLAELLFAAWPHGMGLDQADWDLPELVALAEECEANSTPCSLLLTDGEELQNAVAKIMQDHGLLLVWNGRDGGGGGGDSILGAVSDFMFTGDGTQTQSNTSPINYPAGPVAGTYSGAFSPTGDGSPYPGTGFNGVWIRLTAGGYSGDVQYIRVKAVGPSAQEVLVFERTGVGVMFSAGVRDGGLPAEWLDQNVGPGEDYLCIPLDELAAVVLDETGTWDIKVEYETVFSDAPNNALDVVANISMDQAGQGKWQFRRLREPCTTYDSIPERYFPVPAGMIEGPLPEIEVLHAEKAADRLVFSFNDAEREYRGSTIAIGDDAHAYYLETVRARRVDLFTVVDFAAAGYLAERRSQEELGPQVKHALQLNRAGRVLLPGDRILVAGIAGVLRVVEVELRPLGGGARVQAIPDTYGVYASDFLPPDGTGGTAGPSGTPLEDLAFTILEVPAHLLGAAGSPPAIVVPRIRADQDQAFADLHLSADGTTYELTEREVNVQTGGSLLDAIAATDPWEIDQGPTFTALGADIGEADDLSADELAWRRGVQFALIDDELFALKKVQLVSGTTYRLVGLLRALYDTSRAAHSVGAKVYIFRFDSIQEVLSYLLVPGRNLRVKPQPYSGASVLSLAAVDPPAARVLKGKGIVPIQPGPIDVVAPWPGSPCYETGDDVEFRWSYRSTAYPQTGFGLYPIEVGAGVSPPQGTFEVRVYDAGDALVATYGEADGVGAEGWTYDNADLQADLGGETDFRIEVRNINGGYRSDPVELEVSAL